MKTAHQRITWLALGLLAALTCVSHPTRISAEELRYQGRTFSEWQSDLKDLAPEVRIKAIEALGHFGSRAVPALVPLLVDPEIKVMETAGKTIAKFGVEAVPTMIHALGDKNPLIQSTAAGTLQLIGPGAKDAVPALIRVLKDADAMITVGGEGYKVRQAVAGALGAIGPDAKDAVPGLVEALEDSDPRVRAVSAFALSKVGGPAAKDTLPVLLKLFIREGYNTNIESVPRSLLAYAIGSLSVACPDARLVILAPGKIEKVEIMARFGCWSGDVVARSYPWRVDPSVDVWIQFGTSTTGTRFILYDSERKTGSDEIAQWSGSKMRMWFMAVKKDAEGVVTVQLK